MPNVGGTTVTLVVAGEPDREVRLIARTETVDVPGCKPVTTPFSSTRTLASSPEKYKTEGSPPAYLKHLGIDRDLFGLPPQIEMELGRDDKNLFYRPFNHLHIAGEKTSQQCIDGSGRISHFRRGGH